MSLNNNYGIKTIGKGKQEALNGKWPILGFDVNNIQSTFRTTRIVDSSENSYYQSGNTMPSSSGTNLLSGTEKKLIATYEHGYSHRPMGYFTITGTLNMSASVQLNGTYNLSGTNTIASSRSLYPSMNEFSPVKASGAAYEFLLACSIGTSQSNTIVIPSATPNFPLAVNSVMDYDDDKAMAAYISVEIDAKNVYIYKNYRWYDSWSRYVYSGSDYNDRVRMVAQTTGSIFDVNVYLTPYKIEEMIINE